MVTARDVRADLLISEVKEELKKIECMKPPEWAYYVKTGVSRERSPDQEDWWYIRAASVLRTLYLRGGKPVGVERLRTKYGGRTGRRVRPEHFKKGSGHIIRLILQQLEEAGFVTKVEKKGRKITPQGISFLDKAAARIAKSMELEPGKVRIP